MRLVVVGQGYVGLPLAMAAVRAGYDVLGLEADRERCAKLTQGLSYVEDVPSGEVRSALDTGYIATSDPAAVGTFDVAVITVPTPLTDGAPDLSNVRNSADALGEHVRRGCTIVLESTTYPGTTTEVLVPILEAKSDLRAGPDFHVGYSPERIDPGNLTWGLHNTPKVVAGIDEASLNAVVAFYSSIVDEVVPVSSTEVAELTKMLENTFRHVNIALVNELAMFAADLGVDLWEALEAANTKPFGYMRFRPGPGVGGHCLPVDPSYLSWRVERQLGLPFRFVELANDINVHMPDYVLRRVVGNLNRRRLALNGSRCLVIGVSYKRNTGDARESPGPVLCRLLRKAGAEVRVVDPHVDPRRIPDGVQLVSLNRKELTSSNLVIVVTDHDAIDWEMVASAAPAVLDTCHRLPPLETVEYL